jgi:hypothetical protein
MWRYSNIENFAAVPVQPVQGIAVSGQINSSQQYYPPAVSNLRSISSNKAINQCTKNKLTGISDSVSGVWTDFESEAGVIQNKTAGINQEMASLTIDQTKKLMSIKYFLDFLNSKSKDISSIVTNIKNIDNKQLTCIMNVTAQSSPGDVHSTPEMCNALKNQLLSGQVMSLMGLQFTNDSQFNYSSSYLQKDISLLLKNYGPILTTLFTWIYYTVPDSVANTCQQETNSNVMSEAVNMARYNINAFETSLHNAMVNNVSPTQQKFNKNANRQ